MVLEYLVVLLLFGKFCATPTGAVQWSDGAPTRRGGGRTFVFDASPDLLDVEGSAAGRSKRESLTQSAPTADPKIYTKLNYLNDTHKQLMVHWVGEGSNVIICLARDPIPSNAKTPVGPSSVYISYDYGDTFENKTEMFKLPNGNYSTIEKFYNHPKYNTHAVFTDIRNMMLFVTANHGRNFSRVVVPFAPTEVGFHEYQPQVILVKSNTNNDLWITEDYGRTWLPHQSNVKSFHFLQDDHSQQQLIVQRMEPSNLTTILYSGEFFKSNQLSVYATNVHKLYIKNNYIFYTMKSKKDEFDLYVSYKMGKKLKCIFDTDLELRDFYIVDVTGNRALVAVSHTTTMSHLYVSENLAGSEGNVRFTVSLPSVLAYFPNNSWIDSWLHHTSDDAFTDVYKVEGLSGVYIASQVVNKPTSLNLGPQHLVSRITFDHGSTWRPIAAPNVDEEGQPIQCLTVNNCSLHLSQRFSQLYPETKSLSILSSKSAPGIIVATGVIGKNLKGHYGVYISKDAGITWHQTLRELYFFNMGDHGGVLAAVKYMRMRGESRHILYSTDEGENWYQTPFHNEDLRLYGLMTEPGENTTVFTMFGSLPVQHRWIIVKLDLRNVFKYVCSEDDYKTWSPSQSSDSLRYVPCILGQQLTYKRRIPHANCYNGLDFDRPITMEPCECDSADFECDFGFMRTENPVHCVRNKSMPNDPFGVPPDCKPGQSFNRTKGYRKISGDSCIRGFESHYLPDTISCPVARVPNSLIYAQRERIMRMNLDQGIEQKLDIPKLKNVIAVDYDFNEQYVYWADIVSDEIGRMSLNGSSAPEILVSSDLISVEGMALDWISKNLYFVDGMRAKIELIRTNNHQHGRMRKTILELNKSTKPRGIAVHPKAGYLYWTDWSTHDPSVNRANLDGSKIKRIASKKDVNWPNGITIDYIAERIYWVDAREDYIGSANLHGELFKKVPIASKYVQHPFAVAVFKDDLYWDDWKQNAIFVTDKNNGGSVQTLKANITSGLMDLKVTAFGVQQGKNPCSNISTCSHICVGSPSSPFYSCLCPDGMEQKNGVCLCPGNVEPFQNMTCPQITGTCSADHFSCGNGVCIPKLWRCDNENDCGDNSDEQACQNHTCSSHYFVCPDGKCIPNYWKCDHEVDCVGGSDEENCPKQNCTGSQFSCNNGRCISNRWKCDGDNDCKDNSDEINCAPNEPAVCKSDEFKCKGGEVRCIPLSWRCDGEPDCRDSSDETECANVTCSGFQFACGPPATKCIYGSWVCDGDVDCENGADEKNCSSVAPSTDLIIPVSNPFLPINGTQCQEWMFTCANNRCIPIWWKCDKSNDCEDESDEQGCGYEPTPPPSFPTTTPSWNPNICSQNQFQCKSGVCISQSWVCDKTKDCMSGEDEEHCDDAIHCDPKEQFKCKIDGSCISKHSVCDKVLDCPDLSDEMYCVNDNISPSGPATVSCSVGYFPCDYNNCFPLASMCDSKSDCYDGFDEKDCANKARIYQVLQMGVDERGIKNNTLLLYWWIPMPDEVKLEFLPSISAIIDGKWENKTWTNMSDYTFENLQPFTRYNMTVYVRANGSSAVFPPAKYFISMTGEGIPSEPWNVTVIQKSSSYVSVSWNKPVHPNGIIESYEICWSPPLIKMRLSDNTTSHMITADFEPNTNYSFYVVAYNKQYSSSRSAIKTLLFDGDTEMEHIMNLMVVDKKANEVILNWTYAKEAEGFKVAVEIKEPFPRIASRNTTTKSIQFNGLPSGACLRFIVNAYKKHFTGPPSSLIVNTLGSILPEVNISQAVVIKESGTTVKIAWERPKDKKKVTWNYGIYYGLTIDQLLEKSRYNTTDLSATIVNLDACENYVFSVGIVGPYGVGPLAGNSRSVLTFMNDKAPPKRVSVTEAPDNKLRMLVQWSPSCPNVSTPIGYVINLHERSKNVSMSITQVKSNAQELNHVFKIHYGAVYEVKVSTDVEGALFSPTVVYRAPPIMPPFEIQVYAERKGLYFVNWQERQLPPNIKSHKYIVFVSEGNALNETKAQTFLIDKPPFRYTNNTSHMYTFAVQLETEDGYRSMLSEVISSASTASLTSEEISETSLVSILVPVFIIFVIVGAALGVYVVKYKRLQNSFSRFANSHYSTRSDEATFDSNELEEEDRPQIHGFSDDEPLVIA